METERYIGLIKFVMGSPNSHFHLNVHEVITARTREEWTIYAVSNLMVQVDCGGNTKLLKKLVKILEKADIKHEVDDPTRGRLTVFNWTISKPHRMIVEPPSPAVK